MAVLHRVRHPLARGLTARARRLAALASLLVPGGCEPSLDLQPDSILQDSLGLGPADRTHVVRLIHAQGGEAALPDSVVLREGDWLDFRSGDAWPRTVAFHLDSLPGELRAYLETRGAAASPPLLGAGVHWVLRFDGAPTGRYPFAVSGSGRTRSGVVVVVPPP